jgi:DNA-binding NarL/FixJ family response regulator
MPRPGDDSVWKRRVTAVVRVLVVDDHTVVRKGLCALLATEPGLQVVGEAADGREAVVLASALEPDVVLMDLEMPGMDGVEATRQVLAATRATRIVVLTSFAAEALLLPAVRAGATGYLLKSCRPEDLIRAVRLAADGGAVLDPSVAGSLLREVAGDARTAPTREALTDRERDVLRQLAHGRSNRQIADRLTVSESTVRTHVRHILAKLGLESRTQAAVYALHVGLVRLAELEHLGS